MRLSQALPITATLLCVNRIDAIQRIRSRNLDAVDDLSFSICVELTPDQCIDIIEDRIIHGKHEVTDIRVKVQPPRTNGKGLMEVPVNLKGEVACDINQGFIQYNFPWHVAGLSEPIQLDGVDCVGNTAAQCCEKIHFYGLVVGPDVEGNFLECLVYQESIIPQSNKDSKEISYQDYFYNEGRCEAHSFTREQVDQIDRETSKRIHQLVEDIEDIVESYEVPCSELQKLRDSLYNDARSLPIVQQFVGTLFANDSCFALGEFGQEDALPLTNQYIKDLRMMKQHLTLSAVPHSARNTIVIHTDKNGKICKVPRLGGARGEFPQERLQVLDVTSAY